MRPGLPGLQNAILGVPVDILDPKEVLASASAWLRERETHLVITINSLMILDARKEPELLMPLFEKASLIVPDSYGLLWASRILKCPFPGVYPGVELMLDLCRLSSEKGCAVYLLGGRSGIAEAAARRLKELCPGLSIAGTHSGYFAPGEEATIVEEIRQLRPGVLFVGMGQPKQELWIEKYMRVLETPIAMGVGGSLDVYAGVLRRAPAWLRERGLEWAYRLWQEPSRLPRILRLSRFAAAVIKERLKMKP